MEQYFSPPKLTALATGPLRIRKTKKVQGINGATTIEGSPYFERLLKLIPTEIISIYIFGVGLIPETEKTVLWIWPALCLVMLIVVRLFATRENPSPQSSQSLAVLIASISFLIWLYTLGGIFTTLAFYKSYIGSLAVLVWTFFVPYVYKGD